MSKQKKQPRLSKEVVPTQPQQRKLEDMTVLELTQELNKAHNIIHQCDEQKLQSAQAINSIMAFMEKQDKKEG